MPQVSLNPLDKSSYITLSGDNLVATNTAGSASSGGVRCNLYRQAGYGKFYFEATCTTVGAAASLSFGFATSVATTGEAWVGQNAGTGAGYRMIDNTLRLNGSAGLTPSFTALVVGDVIGCAIDMVSLHVDFYKNGVISSISLGALPSVAYTPKIILYDVGDVVTVNFGSSAFVSLPSGYIEWGQVSRMAIPSFNRVASPRPVRSIGL